MPTPALSIKALGGILDFFVFVGDNPEHVVQLYTSVVGRPVMPPFWGLGFQLSRYGYKNLTHMQKVINRNINNHVPVVSARSKFCTHSCNMLTTFCLQDVNYLDIDYMVRLVHFIKVSKCKQMFALFAAQDEYRDFTYDHTRFKGLPEYMKETKAKNGFYWVVM